MTKDVPSPASDFYNQYVERQNARNAMYAEAEKRRDQVRKIFAQGSYLANEYGKPPYNIDDRFVVLTHPASLKFGDREVGVVVKAEAIKVFNKSPNLPFENFDYVSVYPAERVTRNSDKGISEAIFRIDYSTLKTQTTKENDPEAIQAAAMIMDAIEVDLHETQIQRSQMPQPNKPSVRDRLTTLLNRPSIVFRNRDL